MADKSESTSWGSRVTSKKGKRSCPFKPHKPNSKKTDTNNNNNNNKNNNTPKDKKRKRDDDENAAPGPSKTRAERVEELLQSLKGKLTVEQLYAITIALEGHNQLICGPAGSGKSTLLRSLVAVLTENGYDVAFTATTGIASCQLGNGATTIHSWMGAKFFSRKPEEEAATILENKKLIKRWRSVDYLIWDEISMASPPMLEKFEWVARKVRGNAEPFGGIKMILSGDPFQLDPVRQSKNRYNNKSNFNVEWDPPEYAKMKYFFETDSFKKHITKVVYLSTIFRQSKDKAYTALLNEVRHGQLSKEGEELLMSRVGIELKCPDGIQPTVLLPKRDEVDKINAEELKKLSGKLYSYQMTERYTKDIGELDGKKWLRGLKDNCNAEEKLELKVGSMVVLLVNADLSNGLSNGTQGVIKGFAEMHDPDFGKYMCPIVKFIGQSEPIPVPPWPWEHTKTRNSKTTKKDEFSGAYIKQIPLKLAFALTIHKSQGMTLQFIKTDIGKSIFTVGQAYTALSRVTSIRGLSLLSYMPKAIKTDPRVSEFYLKYAGVKYTSVPDNIRLFVRELAKAKGLIPDDEPDDEPEDQKQEDQKQDEETKDEMDEDDDLFGGTSESEYEEELQKSKKEPTAKKTRKESSKTPPSTTQQPSSPQPPPTTPSQQPTPQQHSPEQEEYIDPEKLLGGKNYYQRLELSRYATEQEIKQAYKKLALKWHPDKNPKQPKLAKINFQAISEAFDTLSDKQKKLIYDLSARF